jgi:death on curing protein
VSEWSRRFSLLMKSWPLIAIKSSVTADHSVCDWGLLKSAIAMPAATFGGQFLHADLCEMAAAYLFHLVQNHPFIDGNKRVGAVAADVFLHINGRELVADQDDYADLVLSVASGVTSKSAVAEFFRAQTEEA